MSLRQDFATDRFTSIGLALDRADLRSAREHAMALRAEYVPVHDGFRDAVAGTLTHLARRHGIETAEKIGQLTIQRLMGAGDPPQYAQAGLRERVRAIAFGWHWHVTRITITEDDHRVSFHLHPCGSGMRLIQEGYYAPGPFGPPGRGEGSAPRLDRSERPTWSSFMKKGFPIYCNHCSEMGHVGLAKGGATFLVEGWTPLRSSGICVQHTYKDSAYVPDEFYTRLGLPLPERNATDSPPDSSRLFTPEELLDLQTHPLDRLIDRSERGDWVAAKEALDECLAGWRDAIHDVYRNWLCVLWKLVHEELGGEILSQTVRRAAPDLFGHMIGATPRQWAAFWSLHLRLREVDERALPARIAFRAGQDSLIQPGILPEDGAWFARQLAAGVSDRTWPDMGTIAVDGDDFVHEIHGGAA